MIINFSLQIDLHSPMSHLDFTSSHHLLLDILFISSTWAFFSLCFKLGYIPHNSFVIFYPVSTPHVWSEKSFHDSKTLIPKSDKNSMREINYKMITIRNTDLKAIGEKFKNWAQQSIKKMSPQPSWVYFRNAALA